MNTPQLSIIIPIYNEDKNIVSLLKEYKKSGKGYSFELICVNNGSTDNTGKILYENKKQYPFMRIVTIKRNIGYGHGIMTGVRRALANVVAWTHADLQTHPRDVFHAFDVYKRENGMKVIVKGRRIGRPLVDTFVSFSMGVIASVFLRVSFSEINAQPKLFHRSFIYELTDAPEDFSLDLFFLYKARKQNYHFITIPVRFLRRKYGTSKWAYSIPSRIRMIRKTIQYIFELRKKSNRKIKD